MEKVIRISGIFIFLAGILFMSCTSPLDPATSSSTASQEFDVLLNGNQAILSWDVVDGASGYKVNYGDSSSYGFSHTTTETMFVISGLKYSTTYYFAVQVENNGEVSDLSEPVKLTTRSGGVFVDLPEELLAPVKADRSDEDIEGAEPFDYIAFNQEWTAWKAQAQDYRFFQLHQCGRYYLSTEDFVRHNTADAYYKLFDEDKSYFTAYTVSDIYKNIARIGEKMEKKKGAQLFLIKYNTEFHYPEYIRIGNYKNSGYDYTVKIQIFTGDELPPDGA
ncbi:MAG: fibronectin type III domain-containing protein [Treponema sp.]|jgi:hypothetical protein|nr:fibronectin type III domain-containing protein [Treponema sp.]